jgi:flagellar protein FlaF
MAVAEIIGASVGVLLLVIVAYLLVGNVLSTSEIVANAQKDLTIQDEARLMTAISISDINIDPSGGINFTVSNNGTESLYNFNHMDVYTYSNSNTGFQYYRYDRYNLRNPGNWSITTLPNDMLTNDIVHPNELDPGTSMIVLITPASTPTWVEFCTDNGVYASANTLLQ